VAFRDRVEAGRRLAVRLHDLRGQDVVVLALPRGGVPVAAEVARDLRAPLDVIVVRKLGVPRQPELAMGAVGEDGVLVVDERLVHAARASRADLAAMKRRARAEVNALAERYRAGRPRASLVGRVALVVDDGVATGSTAHAACQVARAQGARRVVLAVPVCSPDAAARLRGDVDELVYVETSALFSSVGEFYRDFRPTTDAEVVELLGRAPSPIPASEPPSGRSDGPGRG
jgi:putative phosphoribosyl transferase